VTLAIETGDVLKYVVTGLAISFGFFIALMLMRRKSGGTAEKPQAEQPEASTAAGEAPAPRPEASTAAGGAPAPRPPTLEVQALSPSMTDTMPALAAETGEMKMATDELPRMPQLGDAPAQYRTQAAKDLSQAIETGDCPKCKAPTFVGSEDPEEVGADGMAMYKLTGRCGACGHRAELIDMKAP
jgi:hypothetical protein